MAAPEDAGRRVEVLFADEDRVLEIRPAEAEADSVVETVVQAVLRDTPDEAERRIRASVGPEGSVTRR